MMFIMRDELTKRIFPKRHFDGRDENTSDIWLTPPYILEALGEFDLDPCSASHRPWDTAKNHYTEEDNGLSRPWFGRVWLNPPYGRQPPIWLKRLCEHGDGIALIAARTSAHWFHKLIWESADGILFAKGRIHFCRENGETEGSPSFSSCLVAYGGSNAVVLKNVAGEEIHGRYLALK